MSPYRFSIAIPTFRRPTYLADLLKDLAQQQGNFDWSNYEILICDNDALESAKGTFHAYSFPGCLRYSYFSVKEQNISLARNKLVEESSCDAIIFVDDDQRVNRDFLANVEKFWLERVNQIAGAKFQVNPIFDSSEPKWFRQRRLYSGCLPENGSPIVTFATNGCILKTELLKHFKFNALFGRTGGEDFELFLRATKEGYWFASARSITVLERVPQERETLVYLLKRDFFRSCTLGHLIRQGYLERNLRRNIAIISPSAIALLPLVPISLIFGRFFFLRTLLLTVRQFGKMLGFFGFRPKAY